MISIWFKTDNIAYISKLLMKCEITSESRLIHDIKMNSVILPSLLLSRVSRELKGNEDLTFTGDRGVSS